MEEKWPLSIKSPNDDDLSEDEHACSYIRSKRIKYGTTTNTVGNDEKSGAIVRGERNNKECLLEEIKN
jgi:hypothetical protein